MIKQLLKSQRKQDKSNQPNRWLQTVKAAIAAFAALLSMATITLAATEPSLPHVLYGTAQFEGANVAAGTQISALISNTVVATTTVKIDNGQSVYVIDMPGDNPDTVGVVEGGVAGATVSFRVGANPVNQTASWQFGEMTRVNLAAFTAPKAPIAAFAFNPATPNVNDTVQFTDQSSDPDGTVTGWSWTFGDGTTSTLQNPTHVYTSIGTYPVVLTATDNTGLSNTVTRTVVVYVAPVANFTFTPANPALNEPVQFTDASSDGDGTIVSRQWSFGDGATSTQQNPIHAYANVGNFTVILTATDNSGAFAVASKTVTIQARPIANFTTGKEINLAQWEDGASIVDFSSVYAANNSSYRPENAVDFSIDTGWYSANGQPSNQRITIKLASDQAQIVDRVVLRGGAGNEDLRTFEVRISATDLNPASFTTVLTGTLPQDNQLRTINFAPAAARYVQLIALSNYGFGSYLRVRHFEVRTRARDGGIVSLLEGPPARIVAFSSQDNNWPAPNAIDSNNGTLWRSAGNQVSNQSLKISLGGSIRTLNKLQLYTDGGTEGVRDFEVRVSTTISDDAAFTTIFSGTAANNNTTQEFTLPATPAKFVQLFIKNNHGSPSYIRINTLRLLTADGQNVARAEGVSAWIAGYSSRYSDSYPAEHIIDYNPNNEWYSLNGQPNNQWIKIGLLGGVAHQVNAVRMRSYCGAYSVREFQVRVSNTTLDDAAFTTVLSRTLPADCNYHWYTFPPVSAKYVQLYIFNNHNAPYTQMRNFEVYAGNLGGSVVPFDDRSTDPDNAITSWLWDFGNGSTSTERNPLHTFAAPGVYPIKLTVTDATGFTGTTTISYTVQQAPTIDFTWSPTTPNEGQSVSFNGIGNDADGAIVHYQWFFPHNNQRPEAQNTSTSFPDDGQWVAQLTVLDSQLLQTTISKTITTINVTPTLDIGPATVIRRINENITIPGGETFRTLSDPSSPDINGMRYLWEVGDGRTFNTGSVSYAYANPGIYSVTLTVTDPQGATARDTMQIQVFNDTVAPSTTLQIVGSKPSALLENTNIVSLLGNGATVVGYSDRFDANHTPEAMLSYDTAGVPWAVNRNAAGAPHWTKILLANGASYSIDRVRIRPRADTCCPNQRVKDFEVWVSNKTSNDSDFVKVLSASTANNTDLQEFVFPAGALNAKYVKYVVLSNHGNDTYISTAQFQVIATTGNLGVGGVVGSSSQLDANNAPERTLDQDAGSLWRSAVGQNSNQWIKVLLSRGTVQPIHAVSIQPESGGNAIRNFEIQVSTSDDSDASFGTVYSGTVVNNGALQHFFLPADVDAKVVKLVAINNQGGTSVGVAEFQVHTTVPAQADGWYFPKVRIAINATENEGGSGVARIETSTNSGGSWTQYAGPFFYNTLGSTPFWARSTDVARNIEANPAKTILLVDPSIKTGRVEAGQAGVDWLNFAVNNKSTSLGCVACHVQGDTLHGLAIGSASGYKVNRTELEKLVQFITNPIYQRSSDGLWPHPPGGTSFVSANSAHSLFGLAMYDRLVSANNSDNLIRGVNGMLPRQNTDGRWVLDHSGPPTNQGDIQPTVHMIFALQQAKQRVDPATAATYQTSLDKAMNWLKNAQHRMPQTGYNQDRAMKLIGLVEGGVARTDPLVTGIVAEILGDQFADGGWRESNSYAWTSSFATGQSLYALCVAGVSRYDPAVVKAIDWLIHHQATHNKGDAFFNNYALDGPWTLRFSGAGAPFVSAMWPVIALGCFGEVSFELTATPPFQQVAAGQPVTQTIVYSVTLKNSGAETDSYDLTLSGGAAGWEAALDSNLVTLDVGVQSSLSLTVIAPANLPANQIVLFSVVATSQKNRDASRLATVTAATFNVPTQGRPTITRLVDGDGETHRINTPIRIAARVTETVSNTMVAGPDAGVVNFLVGGVAIGSDNDADGDGVYEITWTPDGTWSKLGLQDLRAIYSGIDRPAPGIDLLSSFTSGQITIQAAVTLRISKDDGRSAVEPGQLVTYTITLRNIGNLPSTGLLISDTLPAYTRYLDSSGGTLNGTIVTWSLAQLGALQSVTRSLTLQLDTSLPAPDTISNSVTMIDSAGNSATAQDVDTVSKQAKLSLSKSDEVASATPGSILTYTIVLGNNGYADATNVVLIDTLPQHTSVISASDGGVVSAGSVTWNLSTLAAQSSVSRTLLLKVTDKIPAGVESLTNGVNASAAGGLTASAQDIDVLAAAPVLAVSKDDGRSTVMAGDLLTYTLTISNVGNQAAANLRLTDTLPVSVTLMAASEGGVLNEGQVTWSPFTLAAGDVVVRTVTIQVANPLPAEITSLINTVAANGQEASEVSAQDVDTVVTATPTPIHTPTATITPTATATLTPTFTPTITPTVVISDTPTNTPLPTDTPTSTPTNTPMPTDTPTSTSTNTPVATNTATYTPVSTNTPVVPPTATNTPCPVVAATASDEVNASASIDTFGCPTPTPIRAVITIIKDAQPDSTQDFVYYGPFGEFRLDDAVPDDGDSYRNSISYTVNPGVYNFSEVVPGPWYLSAIQCTPAANAAPDVNGRIVRITVNRGDTITCTFVNQRRVNFSATVYNDQNGDGSRQSGEPVMAGWVIRLYNAQNTLLAHTVTDAQGMARFNNRPPGSYKLCQVVQSGWSNRQPNTVDAALNLPCYALTLQPGEAVEALFGNRQGVAVAQNLSETSNGVQVTVLNDSNEAISLDAPHWSLGLTVSTSASSGLVSVGDVVEYTIVAINQGTSRVNNVVVTAMLPEGVPLLDAGAGTPQADALVWTLDQLEVGESATMLYTVKAPGTIAQLASTSSVQSDEVARVETTAPVLTIEPFVEQSRTYLPIVNR